MAVFLVGGKNKFLMRLHRHVNVDFCCWQNVFLSDLPRNSKNWDRGVTICLSGFGMRAVPIFTFLDRRLRPDDNIDSGERGGEVGDMKLFCRRFAAAPQKRVRKCEKLCESMKDGFLDHKEPAMVNTEII